MDAEHLAIHTAFDALAWASAAGLAYALTKYARIAFPVAPAQRPGYYAALVASSGVGRLSLRHAQHDRLRAARTRALD